MKLPSEIHLLVITFFGIAALPCELFADDNDFGEFVHFAGGPYEYVPVGMIGERQRKQMTRVVIPEFWLSQNEVSIRDFDGFVRSTGYETSVEQEVPSLRVLGFVYVDGTLKTRDAKTGDGTELPTYRSPGYAVDPQHPATCLSFADVSAYCQWLTDESDFEYRIPTAAEWEFTISRDGRQVWSFPAEDVAKYENLKDESLGRLDKRYAGAGFDDGFAFPAPVNAKAIPNTGLRFMHGNVCEMCRCNAEVLLYKKIRDTVYVICGHTSLADFDPNEPAPQILVPKRTWVSNYTGFRLLRTPKAGTESISPPASPRAK